MTKAIAAPPFGLRSVGGTKGGATGGGEVWDAREAVGERVLAGKHREHAGHGARRRDVDGADQRMGMRRAHRGAIGLARQIDVVAVIAAAGDEACVFLAAYRLSDACVHDGESTKLGGWREAIVSQRNGRGYPPFRLFLLRMHGSGTALWVFCLPGRQDVNER